ncbi:MAG TPA: type I restriction endonuclease, partial [Anaerolineales bacterium]|nr:type I restriction endonuclease [Anaerolineales bacterium]
MKYPIKPLMPNLYCEDALIEQPAIRLFKDGLGWESVDCYDETFGANGTLGREHKGEVVLISRLRTALIKLNPRLPAVAIESAIVEITRDRSVLLPVTANHEIYKLLKEGVRVSYKDEKGIQHDETVRVIDWEHPHENDFLLASQFWISGWLYTRRTDLLGFINGIPLVFIELKSSHRKLQSAYQDNLRDYKESIPQLFWYNAFIILSNGTDSRVGSLSSKWEHFNEWKRINSEGERGVISLDTILKGMCEKTRLLDLIENFTLFTENKDGPAKLIAKNHQFLGVNNAVDSVQGIKTNQGRLGVFWHTQGSGKSYSMIFFAQKVQRKLAGNWTFLIVTDRIDLDDQIYKNFASTGTVTEPEESARSQSTEHLKRMLAEEDHRYIFTTIQKFGTKSGEVHPKL